MRKKNLIGLLPSDIYSWLEEEGEPSFRARQIFQWIYEKKAGSFFDMTNLPVALREKLDSAFSLGSSQIKEIQKSKDGTVKFLIHFPPQDNVETFSSPTETCRTLCLSTQVGCPAGCTFVLRPCWVPAKSYLSGNSRRDMGNRKRNGDDG